MGPRLRALRLISVLVFALMCAQPAMALTGTREVPVSPNKPTSGELVDEPRKWDGKTITFTGEAIGERMRRGESAWIHVNDDAYYLYNVEEGATLGGYNSGHAIWLPMSLAQRITFFGDYTHEGDVIAVRGVFNATCAEHGGDMDIHAREMRVLQMGHVVHEPVKPIKLAVGLLLAALAGVFWAANRRVEHKELRGLFGPR